MKRGALDVSFDMINLQLGAINYARIQMTRQSVSAEMLVDVGLSHLVGKQTKSRDKAVKEEFEVCARQIRHQGIVTLVSVFEAELFKMVATASRDAKARLNLHGEGTAFFGSDIERFVRTVEDFANLGGFKRFMMKLPPSPTDPRADLWDVVSYRDYLAHGERWPGPSQPPSLQSAYETLSRELARVRRAAAASPGRG